VKDFEKNYFEERYRDLICQLKDCYPEDDLENDLPLLQDGSNLSGLDAVIAWHVAEDLKSVINDKIRNHKGIKSTWHTFLVLGNIVGWHKEYERLSKIIDKARGLLSIHSGYLRKEDKGRRDEVTEERLKMWEDGENFI
jgi:hypothetical protein